MGDIHDEMIAFEAEEEVKDVTDMDFTELHIERSRLHDEQNKLRDRQKVVEDLIYADHLDDRGKVERDIEYLRQKGQDGIHDLKKQVAGMEGVGGCAVLISLVALAISILVALDVFK